MGQKNWWLSFGDEDNFLLQKKPKYLSLKQVSQKEKHSQCADLHQAVHLPTNCDLHLSQSIYVVVIQGYIA